MTGTLDHRDVTLRAVSAACKLVTRKPQGATWNEFRMQVVSAVGEAFNNIVLHGYDGRGDGEIEIEIRATLDRITIAMRDYGSSFDPTKVPLPDFDALPESGWGLFIIRAFMDISYTPGSPNVLTLSKTLPPEAAEAAESGGDVAAGGQELVKGTPR
jgi:serine/threonine-protein kinase RsbW